MIMATDISVLAIAEQWPFLPILERFGVAIAIGVFVGIEREYSVAWIAMWRRYLSDIWRKRSFNRIQLCPTTRLSLAAMTISLDTISA
jgi:hypothetical protein